MSPECRAGAGASTARGGNAQLRAILRLRAGSAARADAVEQWVDGISTVPAGGGAGGGGFGGPSGVSNPDDNDEDDSDDDGPPPLEEA